MRIPLTICLLFCVQSAWGAERYFLPEVSSGWASFSVHRSQPRQAIRISGSADIDVTIDGELISIPETVFSFSGHEHYCALRGRIRANRIRECEDIHRTFDVDGGVLDLFADVIIPATTLPLPPPDYPTQSVRRTPWIQPSVRVYGTYQRDGVLNEFEEVFESRNDRCSFCGFKMDVYYHNNEVGGINARLSLWDFSQFRFGRFYIGGNWPNMTFLDLNTILASQDWKRGLPERVPTAEERAVLLPGDADMDGEVSFADFFILQRSAVWGNGRGTWGHGDFNGDFNVDFADFLILADNFGNVRTQAAAVPEPGLAVLLLPAVLLLRRRR